MANMKKVLQTIGADAVKVGKVVAWPFIHAAKLVETVEVGLKDEPKAKAAIVGLIQRIETLGTDGAAAWATKGIDLPADIRELLDAKALFEYVRDVFIPTCKEVYGDIAPEIEALTAAAGEPEPLTGEAATPGLHNVVPA